MSLFSCRYFPGSLERAWRWLVQQLEQPSARQWVLELVRSSVVQELGKDQPNMWF
jgi:hypothetical protein